MAVTLLVLLTGWEPFDAAQEEPLITTRLHHVLHGVWVEGCVGGGAVFVCDICMSVYLCMYVCMYVYLCIFTISHLRDPAPLLGGARF